MIRSSKEERSHFVLICSLVEKGSINYPFETKLSLKVIFPLSSKLQRKKNFFLLRYASVWNRFHRKSRSEIKQWQQREVQ